MNQKYTPSINYCCNGLINFSIYSTEKLVCKLKYENGRILFISRRIDTHV